MQAVLEHPRQSQNLSSTPRYRVRPHGHHPRLRHVSLEAAVVADFLHRVGHVDIQHLQYVPFMRYMLGEALEACAGAGFSITLNEIARDRATGGFTLNMEGVSDVTDDYVRFGTAVSHLLGSSNHDAMSRTYFARFFVKDTDSSDSYLRQAYRPLTLHTDGTFVSEATEWLLMMKFGEVNATGGESRFLHIDDWDERSRFLNHPLGSHAFHYKAPGSKNVDDDVERPVFFDSPFGLAVSFIDQFVQPRSREEAVYLHDLSASMEASLGTREVPLALSELVVLNNYFWLHGRAPFQKNPELQRELMRQRGTFCAAADHRARQ
jgi:glutarate dioxygenase